MAAQIPVICLARRKSGAVYSRLLTRADTDSLPVIGKADGVRLREFERDERDYKIGLCSVRDVLVFRNNVVEQLVVDPEIVASLLKRHAEYLLLLNHSRNIFRIDLYDVVVALAL